MIQHRGLVRHLLKELPDDRIRNKGALMNTKIRCAKVESRESGALQGPREGGKASPQHNRAEPAEP